MNTVYATLSPAQRIVMCRNRLARALRRELQARRIMRADYGTELYPVARAEWMFVSETADIYRRELQTAVMAAVTF